MFTGIVQCLGKVTARHCGHDEMRVTILPCRPFADPQPGESISVNGVCLTAEQYDGAAFTAYASGETLSRTTLAPLRPGDIVNLEQAVALGTRLGGHLVSGHVDCLARVESLAPRGSSLFLRMACPHAFAHLIVPKGSIALDGISLTINECGCDHFTVNVIPETQAATTIHTWRPGRNVNMETDLIGKYVVRLAETGHLNETASAVTASPGGLTLESLRESGF